MGLPDKNNAVKLASTYVCQVVELDSAALAREEREKTIGCHNQRVNKGCTRAVNKRSHCCSRDRRTSQNVHVRPLLLMQPSKHAANTFALEQGDWEVITSTVSLLHPLVCGCVNYSKHSFCFVGDVMQVCRDRGFPRGIFQSP